MLIKNTLIKLSFLTLIFLIAQPAYSIVQFRLNYGVGQPKGFDMDDIDHDTGEIGGDVIVSVPLIPVIFGLRYEKITADESELEIDLGRISVITGYRLIDTLVYAGLIGTFGIINDGEMIDKVSGSMSDIDMDNSFTAGIEAGLNMSNFIIGIEAGYRVGKDDGQESNEFEYTGTYGKAVLGYDF